MKFSFIIFFIITFTSLNAQIRTSVANLLRYGNGTQSIGKSQNNFEYFENLTDVRLSLPENVTAGFRFLYDDPPEVGLPFQGISRRFIEYRKNNLSLRVGNSSELYGKGLVLNLFENRGLAYDTWIDGIKASYKWNNLRASLIAGEIEFTDSINIYRTETYKIRGGNIEYKLFPSTKIGFSFIRSESIIPQFDQSNANTIAELPELYLDYTISNFNIFLNWAHKWTTSSDLKTNSKGYGIYSALSFAEENLGITVDYKNYQFDLQNPFLQNDETRTTKFLPFQNPPIVMKEQSYTLLSRSIHEVNFNDEVGLQVDINYAFSEDLSLNLNLSLSSKHNSYNYNVSRFSFDEEKRNNNFLPSTEGKYSPYTEIGLEGDYYISSTTVLRFGTTFRNKIYYNDIVGIDGSHEITSLVIPFQLQYLFNKNLSTQFQYEFEKIEDNYNTGQENFNNQFVSIITSIYRKATIGLRYEFTNNEFDISGRKDWFLGELGYRISGKNLITLSYGRERGGQICSNGICRYILPFKGFRITLQTSL